MTTNDERQARQGDVFFLHGATIKNGRIEPLAKVPTGLKPAPRRPGERIAAALGEATGHAHAIHAPGVTAFTKDGDDLAIAGGGVLVAEAPVEVVHEEHSPIPIPQGLTTVIRQVEYPLKSRPRRVAD